MNQFMNIPEELKLLPQLVCRKEKIPFNPVTGAPAKAGQSTTWASFKDYINALEGGGYDGISYEFNNNGIVGIDLDHMVAEDGSLSEEAVEIVAILDSYTEYSLSGKGLHIFIKGDIPVDGRKKGFIEIYKAKRYFAMIGRITETNHLGNSTHMMYDGINRLVEVRDAYGAIIQQLTYNDANAQESSYDALGNEIRFHYDRNLRQSGQIDGKGNRTYITYDYRGNINGKKDENDNTTSYAAMDFSMGYNNQSIDENKELGSTIYMIIEPNIKIKKIGLQSIIKNEPNVYFSYNKPLAGSKDGVVPNLLSPIKPFAVVVPVATIHSHGSYLPSYGKGNDSFSSGKHSDIWWSEISHLPSFMVNPKGELKLYNPHDNTTKIISSEMPHDSNHPDK